MGSRGGRQTGSRKGKGREKMWEGKRVHVDILPN